MILFETGFWPRPINPRRSRAQTSRGRAIAAQGKAVPHAANYRNASLPESFADRLQDAESNFNHRRRSLAV